MDHMLKLVHGLFSVKTRRILMCFGVVAVSALPAKAGMQDACIFSLKMLGDTVTENGKVDLAEVGNGMTVGKPGGWETATRGNAATPLAGQEPISFSTKTIPPVYWKNSVSTNACTVLHFPQTVITTDEGVISNAEQALTFSYSARDTDLRSGHFRFRWEGYAFSTIKQSVIFSDGWTWSSADESSFGYSFLVQPDSDGIDRLYFWLGGRNSFVYGLAIEENVWYDVFFALQTTDTMHVTVMSGTSTKSATVTLGHNANFREGVDPKIIIGGQKENSDTWRVGEIDTATSKKVFRGDFAKLDLYEGTLSPAELMALAAGHDGKIWSVGSKNGSSCEFGSDPVGEYDPLAMEYGRMRGELTSENPSLTLKYRIPANDAGFAKFLTVNPLPVGVGETCTLSLTVNGKAVGALGAWSAAPIDAASGEPCTFFVPGDAWNAGEDGFVRIVLARTGTVTGTLGIDSLDLSGSWQLGTADDAAADLAHDGRSPDVFYIGDTDVSNHLRRATYPIGSTVSSISNLVLRCWVPESVAKRCRAILELKVSNAGTAIEGDDGAENFTVKVGEHEMFRERISVRDPVTVNIPVGAFAEGFNDIKIMNVSSAQKLWMQYDFFRLTYEVPRGLAISIR